MQIGMDTSSIQTWVAAHTNQLWSDMKAQMRDGDQRRALIKELNGFKAQLARCKDSPEQLTIAHDRLKALLDKHPDLKGAFGPMLSDLEWETGKYAQKAQKHGAAFYNDGEKSAIGDYCSPEGKWGSAVRALVDGLNEDGQMALINIQDLNSKLQQSQQLGSNLTASIHQTQLAIINNMRG